MSSEEIEADSSPVTLDNFDPETDSLSDILSTYEIQRKPLQPLTEGSCSVNGTSLTRGTLICPICLSILRNVKTVMKCLHRFCEECIGDAIRKGRRECPTCRVKVASHRDMRSEPRIDFILGTLLGDLDEWEDKHELQVEQLTQSLNIDALRVSVAKGMARQALRKRKRQDTLEVPKSIYVGVELKPHPEWKEIIAKPRQFLAAQDETSIHQLKRYILAQIRCQGQSEERELQLFACKRAGRLFELFDEKLKNLPISQKSGLIHIKYKFVGVDHAENLNTAPSPMSDSDTEDENIYEEKNETENIEDNEIPSPVSSPVSGMTSSPSKGEPQTESQNVPNPSMTPTMESLDTLESSVSPVSSPSIPSPLSSTPEAEEAFIDTEEPNSQTSNVPVENATAQIDSKDKEIPSLNQPCMEESQTKASTSEEGEKEEKTAPAIEESTHAAPEQQERQDVEDKEKGLDKAQTEESQ